MFFRKLAHYILLAACIVGGWNPAARAATAADAEGAIARGDYSAAVSIFEALSTSGDLDAMVSLAHLYQTGTGVKKNLPRAVELYTAAAERDNAEAEFSLGNLYLMGEGVPQDDDWAFTYYRRAADHGHPLAEKNIREFYRAAGVEPPPASSAKTEVAPVEAPNAPPAHADTPQPDIGTAPIPSALSADELRAIGVARARGFEVHVDGAELPASDSNPKSDDTTAPIAPSPAPPSAEAVAPLAEIRELLAIGDTVRAQAKLEPLANHNNAEAQFLFAQLLETAPSESTSADQAMAWLKLSAAAGYAEAEFKLAERYLSGHGVTVDEAEAITWYRSAARHGHDGAKQKLATIYRDAGLTEEGHSDR